MGPSFRGGQRSNDLPKGHTAVLGPRTHTHPLPGCSPSPAAYNSYSFIIHIGRVFSLITYRRKYYQWKPQKLQIPLVAISTCTYTLGIPGIPCKIRFCSQCCARCPKHYSYPSLRRPGSKISRVEEVQGDRGWKKGSKMRWPQAPISS